MMCVLLINLRKSQMTLPKPTAQLELGKEYQIGQAYF